MRLIIEGSRNWYSIEECGSTMTVSELINYLGQFEGGTPIYLGNDMGSYAPIEYHSISEDEDCEGDDD